MSVRIVLISLLFIIISINGTGQNITVINHYGDTTGVGDNAAFQLQGTTQHTLIINYYEPANAEQSGRLEQLIGNALDFYIDESIEIKGGKVKFKKSKSTVVKEMNQIVQDAVKFYKYKEIAGFDGFSDNIKNKVNEIEALSLASRPVDGSDRNELQQINYYTVQKELNELKLMANTEVGNYSNDNLMVVSATEEMQIDPVNQQALYDEINNFKKNDPLTPMEFELTNASITLLASTDEFILPDYTPVASTAIANDDFAAKVFDMLERNNEKLDNLSSEIDKMKAEREQERIEQQELTNNNMQSQIDELRTMIVDLVKGDNPTIQAPEKPLPVENLPNTIRVTFGKGSSMISVSNKLMLNEVIDILAHNPSLKIMVTGHADKTGDSQSNVLLSQKRARSVSGFVSQSGIEDSRIIMNYFGDKNSSSANSADRKVVIEFLPY